jgi:hypothetical protein
MSITEIRSTYLISRLVVIRGFISIYNQPELALLASELAHRREGGPAMTHIAIQEKLDGKVVDWMEQVSDEQYQGVT